MKHPSVYIPDAPSAYPSVRSLGTGAQQATAGNDSRHLTGVDRFERMFDNPCRGSSGFVMLTGVAYWVFVGRVTVPSTAKYIETVVTSAGSGAQTAELALASTPTAPNKGGLSLTKIVATGTVDSLAGTGIVRNTSSFAQAIAAGTYLWAGMRTAMASTQPTMECLFTDNQQGFLLSTAASGALTGAGPFAGSIIAFSTINTLQAPRLRVVLD